MRQAKRDKRKKKAHKKLTHGPFASNTPPAEAQNEERFVSNVTTMTLDVISLK